QYRGLNSTGWCRGYHLRMTWSGGWMTPGTTRKSSPTGANAGVGVPPLAGGAGRADSRRGPSRSLWKMRIGTVKVPSARTTIGCGTELMPTFQDSVTRLPGGKFRPVTAATKPGGPSFGAIVRTGARTTSGAVPVLSAGLPSTVGVAVPDTVVFT